MIIRRLSIIEIIVIIACALFLIALIFPYFNTTRNTYCKVTNISMVKSLGLILISYGEDDLVNNKLPYPCLQGEEKVWGNSKYCWSTSVAEMLFVQKYMRKGEESQLRLDNYYEPNNFKSMVLDDNTKFKNEFWMPNSTLDFQIFCDKDLTSNEIGKKVLVATYDNDDIRNCLFEGEGWIVFYADKTTEFIKRRTFQKFSKNSNDPAKISVDLVEGNFNSGKAVSRKFIPVSLGGPGTFGLGGGSTELMGKTPDDEIYKRLVK